MTKPISASQLGLKPYYRVRVVLPHALPHLASWTEPKIDQDLTTRVEGDWIDDPQYRVHHRLDKLGSHHGHHVEVDRMTTTPQTSATCPGPRET